VAPALLWCLVLPPSLWMANEEKIPVQCPACGRGGEASAYPSLNPDADPELKDRLMTGDLFSWKCPACGTATVIPAYPFFYHDMREGLMILCADHAHAPGIRELIPLLPPAMECAPLADIGVKFAQMVGRRGMTVEGYRFRVVRGWEDLQEKIRILEAGLDDRAVEWEKYLYYNWGLASFAGEPLRPDFPCDLKPVRFLRCYQRGLRRIMSYTGLLEPRGRGDKLYPQTMDVEDRYYTAALSLADIYLPWPEPVRGSFRLVDRAWIERAWHRLPDLRKSAPRR
jgi:hypothetical protein